MKKNYSFEFIQNLLRAYTRAFDSYFDWFDRIPNDMARLILAIEGWIILAVLGGLSIAIIRGYVVFEDGLLIKPFLLPASLCPPNYTPSVSNPKACVPPRK